MDDTIATKVIKGILESPLEFAVKQALMGAVNTSQEEIRMPNLRYLAPEQLHPVYYALTESIMHRVIDPVLLEHNVPAINGRDTWFHIYEKLGGTKPVTYSVPTK